MIGCFYYIIEPAGLAGIRAKERILSSGLYAVSFGLPGSVRL
jgi:hypothetical protein